MVQGFNRAAGVAYPGVEFLKLHHHGALVDQVATNLFGRVLAPEHKTAVLAFLGVADSKPVAANSAAVSYGLNSFVSVLLDSPYMSLR